MTPTDRISRQEKTHLRRSATQTPGDELDRKDAEGDRLNEGDLLTDRFGEDLDLPESEEVDEEDSE